MNIKTIAPKTNYPSITKCNVLTNKKNYRIHSICDHSRQNEGVHKRCHLREIGVVAFGHRQDCYFLQLHIFVHRQYSYCHRERQHSELLSVPNFSLSKLLHHQANFEWELYRNQNTRTQIVEIFVPPAMLFCRAKFEKLYHYLVLLYLEKKFKVANMIYYDFLPT